ncbi:MAG: acyl-CoA/acyl-ACP dehydrogenase [Anaerolineaceae bacterium]|nr:acyl-CoA/acyl-ACP dehydrogenase [Anaerolineaceae bacterium]
MSIQLSTPIELARQLAADFATRASEADRIGRLPAEDVQQLKDSGYLTLTIPREYGGEGLSLRDTLAAHIELAQGSPSTALVAGMQLHIFGNLSETRTWDEEKFAWVCQLGVTGGLLNSISSEPALGSPSRGAFFKSTAALTPEGWAINGHKTWSTGGTHLTHLLVKVSIETDSAIILVPNHLPGITWEATWNDSLSLRASDSHDVRFANVIVPEDHLLQRGQPGPEAPNAWFPMMMGTVYLGAALAARNTVIQYALERVPTALGKPIATLPKIQRQIGEIDLALQAATALMFDAAEAWGRGEHAARVFPQIVAAKHLMTETANNVTDEALRIAGGISITRTLPLERYFRDVRAGLMQPPSGDTALEIIGRGAIDRLKNGSDAHEHDGTV